jgi:LmbE family N-acetylglucosaminyl deacetylase
MKLFNSNAEFFVPDNASEEVALKRTTDLCIAAHQDDIEIMAYGAISECFDNPNKAFTGVVVTDGAGSPRSGDFEKFTDEQMKSIRVEEQKKAATIGKYSCQYLLGYSSSCVKDSKNKDLIQELKQIIFDNSPEVVYTHNLADKHDTHVALALRTIEAIRSIPKDLRPKKVYSLEVWRGLDWLCDEDKVVFDTSNYKELENDILQVFESQISGGKRYDKAAIGRRLANATFFASHNVDSANSAAYGIDLTELIVNEDLSPIKFIENLINKFSNEVTSTISKY